MRSLLLTETSPLIHIGTLPFDRVSPLSVFGHGMDYQVLDEALILLDVPMKSYAISHPSVEGTLHLTSRASLLWMICVASGWGRLAWPDTRFREYLKKTAVRSRVVVVLLIYMYSVWSAESTVLCSRICQCDFSSSSDELSPTYTQCYK
jgi:hypothetical protein